jgi:hypothetical protein
MIVISITQCPEREIAETLQNEWKYSGASCF